MHHLSNCSVEGVKSSFLGFPSKPEEKSADLPNHLAVSLVDIQADLGNA
ncbi:hypothetical protein [Desulfosarcina sp.]